MTTLNKAQSLERKAFLEKMPILKSDDIADSVVYALSTPEHVQVSEMFAKSWLILIL
jgi:NADP+-dependent farnesol dehydrogenase